MDREPAKSRWKSPVGCMILVALPCVICCALGFLVWRAYDKHVHPPSIEYILAGEVVDQSGQPVRGVTVYITEQDIVSRDFIGMEFRHRERRSSQIVNGRFQITCHTHLATLSCRTTDGAEASRSFNAYNGPMDSPMQTDLRIVLMKKD